MVNQQFAIMKLDKYKLLFFLPFVFTTLNISIISFVGYYEHITGYYRAFSFGPAMNPMTSIVITLLGISMFFVQVRGKSGKIIKCLILAATIICIIKLIDEFAGTNILESISPFRDQIINENQSSGSSNRMGLNTAIMFLFIGISILFYISGKEMITQLFSSIAFLISLTAYIGYLLNMRVLYGEMSIFTATSGFLQAGTSLGLTIIHGLLTNLNIDESAEKITILQLFISYILAILFGFFLYNGLGSYQNSIMAIIFIGVIWFVTLMTGTFSLLLKSPE